MTRLLAVLVGVVVAESALRLALTLGWSPNPAIFFDAYSDDRYWRMVKTGTVATVPGIIRDDMLGWRREFRPAPVMFFGDSFVDSPLPSLVGASPCGVSGYGVDQICMAASLYGREAETLLVGIMTLDVDRAILTYRGADKPRLVSEPRQRRLTASYAGRLAVRAAQVALARGIDSGATSRTDEKVAALEASLDLLPPHAVVVLMYPPQDSPHGWRAEAVRQGCAKRGLRLIDTRGVLAGSYDSTGHPAEVGYHILAMVIKEAV